MTALPSRAEKHVGGYRATEIATRSSFNDLVVPLKVELKVKLKVKGTIDAGSLLPGCSFTRTCVPERERRRGVERRKLRIVEILGDRWGIVGTTRLLCRMLTLDCGQRDKNRPSIRHASWAPHRPPGCSLRRTQVRSTRFVPPNSINFNLNRPISVLECVRSCNSRPTASHDFVGFFMERKLDPSKRCYRSREREKRFVAGDERFGDTTHQRSRLGET